MSWIKLYAAYVSLTDGKVAYHPVTLLNVVILITATYTQFHFIGWRRDKYVKKKLINRKHPDAELCSANSEDRSLIFLKLERTQRTKNGAGLESSLII